MYSCTIQNSIVASFTSIPDQTSLINCQVGYEFEVEQGEYKGEMLCNHDE